MRPSPSTRTLPNQMPPCGEKYTPIINPTPAPHSSPATPPRIIHPLPPSELQQNVKAALSRPPSFDGRPTTHSTPTIPTASDKERTTLPYAPAPTLPIPNLIPLNPTYPTDTLRNTSCSTAPGTPTHKPHTSMASPPSRSSSVPKKTPPGYVPLRPLQTARSSVRSITRLPGRTLCEFPLS
jgi:hypothetical protein